MPDPAFPAPWKVDTGPGCKRIRACTHAPAASGNRRSFTQIAYTVGLSEESEDWANAQAARLVPHFLAGQPPAWTGSDWIAKVAEQMTDGPWMVQERELGLLAVGPAGNPVICLDTARLGEAIASAPDAVAWAAAAAPSPPRGPVGRTTPIRSTGPHTSCPATTEEVPHG